MSAISNNITFHQNHGDSPQVTKSNIVLSSMSIRIHKRWKDPDQVSSPNVLSNLSIRIHKRWKDPDQLTTPIVAKTTSFGYYGWKYLNDAISQLATTEEARIRHHK